MNRRAFLRSLTVLAGAAHLAPLELLTPAAVIPRRELYARITFNGAELRVNRDCPVGTLYALGTEWNRVLEQELAGVVDDMRRR